MADEPPQLLTLAWVVARCRGWRGRQWGKGGGCRTQGSNHLHHAGYQNVCGADSTAALQHWPICLFLYMDIGLDRHWPPAARGLNGDFLIVRAADRESVSVRVPLTPPTWTNPSPHMVSELC